MSIFAPPNKYEELTYKFKTGQVTFQELVHLYIENLPPPMQGEERMDLSSTTTLEADVAAALIRRITAVATPAPSPRPSF